MGQQGIGGQGECVSLVWYGVLVLCLKFYETFYSVLVGHCLMGLARGSSCSVLLTFS
jgi:hypothetical protein